MVKKISITGSAGLIGSESAKFFGALGFEIHEIDNVIWKRSFSWLKKEYVGISKYVFDFRLIFMYFRKNHCVWY